MFGVVSVLRLPLPPEVVPELGSPVDAGAETPGARGEARSQESKELKT